MPSKGEVHIRITTSGIQDFHTNITFQAIVHAILQNEQGEIGKKLSIHEYIISVLDHSLPKSFIQKQIFSQSTARALDAAAIELVWSGKAECPINVWAFPTGGAFASLSRCDRLNAIDLLERLEIDIGSLPEPYKNNPSLIQSIKNTLTQLTLLGYYSEWSGFGSTRLLPPEYRRLEYFPYGWIQTNYPGPAFGYRNLRGFLLKFPRERGNVK